MIFLQFLCLEQTMLVICGKIFLAFNKQITIRFSKTQFPCPGKQFENFFWEKFWFFNLLSTLTKFFLVFGKKNLRPGLSKFHLASPDEGFEDFVFEKTMILCTLCTLSGKVSHFCKTFTARFPKHQSKCPGKLFAKSFFFKTDGIILFPFFEQKTEEVG